MNGRLEFGSEVLIVSILSYTSNDIYVPYLNMITLKIVLTKFCNKK